LKILVTFAAVGGLCLLRIAAALPPPNAAHVSIQAELIKGLDVRRIQAGSSVFVRVIEDWSGLGCTLRSGSIIEARVETAQPRVKPNNDSQLVLSFAKAQCNGDEMAPIDLVLAAVSWSPDDSATLRGQYPIVKRVVGAGGVTVGNGDPKAASNHQGLVMNGIEFKASSLFVERPALHAGDIYGIRGVKLRMGVGPGGSSLIYSKSRDVVLDQYTQFLLLPTSVAFVPSPKPAVPSVSIAAGTASKLASPIVPAPAPPAPPKEFEPCSPPLCSVDLPVAGDEGSNHPSKSIAIHSLGYAPRLNRDISQLDNEEALMWVGEQQMLVAFNPHTLVHRNGMSTIDAPIRKIHAVLLDIATNRALSTVDWELSDSGRFLWQLCGNQILVHAENELRVYDSKLILTSRFPLAGPLGFVRISPNGELMAIGIIRERHSHELHQKLVEDLGQNPEEDVEIMVLDKEFKVIAEASTTSDLMPPTLLNEGQVTLLAQPNKRYRLAMSTWENQTVTLARFSSACTPELSSFAPDLIFIRSCDKTSSLPEFRVLRTDGRVVWREQPNPEEFGHEAKGNESSRTFAIKFLHASSDVRPGSVFHGTDLVEAEVRVYRAGDGKRLSSFHSEAPAPSHGGYSLSPDGSQLAMLSGGQIIIYPVPTN
jgi:hypothetical protein